MVDFLYEPCQMQYNTKLPVHVNKFSILVPSIVSIMYMHDVLRSNAPVNPLSHSCEVIISS